MIIRYLKDATFADVEVGQKFFYNDNQYVKIPKTFFDSTNFWYTINAVCVDNTQDQDLTSIRMLGDLFEDKCVVEVEA